MSRALAILFVLLALPMFAQEAAWTTPSDTKAFPWDDTGYAGGLLPPTFPIVAVITNFTAGTGGGPGGTLDNSRAWTNALAAAVASLSTNAGAAVLFTPGIWLITNQIAIPNNIDVRIQTGANLWLSYGTGNQGRGDSCITAGNDVTRTTVAVTAGLTRGSVSLTVASNAGLHVGDLFRLTQTDDPNVLFTNRMTPPFTHQGQMGTITNISGTTIGIDSPLVDTNWQSAYNPTLESFSNPGTNFGISGGGGITNIGGPATFNIYFTICRDFWISSIFSTNALHSNIELEDCYHYIVQDSDTYGHSITSDSNAHEGASAFEHSTKGRFVNCNFQGGNTGFKFQECVANAVAYCSSYIGWIGSEGGNNSSDGMSSHGLHARHNLKEGNSTIWTSEDEFWGDNRTETDFRNYILRWGYGDHASASVVNQGQNGVFLDATNRFMNYIGNVIGTSRDIGDNVNYSWEVGYARSSGPGLNNNPPAAPYDANTMATAFLYGNYDMRNGQYTNIAPSANSISNSMIFASRPWWFTNTYSGTNFQWPLFGPDVSTAGDVTHAFNPADWRWRYHTNCFIDPWITQQPQSQSVSVGQSVTFTAPTVGNSQRLYQWRKNGANLAGATASSFNIASAQNSDAAVYTVFVQDQEGTILSANANLNVGGVLGGGSAIKTYGKGTHGAKSGTR